MLIYVGIDLGKDGAVVLLDEGERIVTKVKTPLVRCRTKDGEKLGRDEYDIPKMAAMLADAKSMASAPIRVVLEKAQPMPKSMGGGLANYSRGLSFGLWQGLLVGLSISYEVVRPQAWQKVMLAGISSSDTKQASIIAAKRIWPGEDWCKTERSKMDDNGYTDAALLALYGLRIGRGKQ